MTEIDKIKRYVERTSVPRRLSTRYDCYTSELESICKDSRNWLEALSLAFEYGKAKGYRAGKAAKNGQASN